MLALPSARAALRARTCNAVPLRTAATVPAHLPTPEHPLSHALLLQFQESREQARRNKEASGKVPNRLVTMRRAVHAKQWSALHGLHSNSLPLPVHGCRLANRPT